MSEPRYRTYGQRDETPLLDGDSFFKGVRENLDPDKLPEGIVASATNKRFINGRAEPRPGIAIMPWMKGTGTTPFSTTTYAVHGMGVFSEPDGAEWLMVAAEGGVYAILPNNVALSVPLPAGVTITSDVEFVQTFARLVMLRGFDLAPLVLDTIGEGFKEITDQTSGAGNGTGTLPIPNATFGEVFQNRLLLVGDGDLGYVSDIGNMTRYLIGRAFRINEGSSDRLKRFYGFGNDTILAFKGESVYPITGLTPDTAGDWSGAVLGDVTRTHGLAAAGAVTQCGKDVYYLSTHGLTSLRLTEQNKLQATDVALSVTLNKTWSRINWSAISAARLAYWTDGGSTSRLYCALPLDDATLLDPANLATDAGGVYPKTLTVSGLTAGKTYRWTSPYIGNYLTNGADTLLGSGDFIAAGTSVSIYQSEIPTATNYDMVQLVIATQCNTAVAVFDFETGEWAGTDEAGAITSVKRFAVMTFNGQERLFALGNDGVLRLYEEGFQDEEFQTVTPYVEVLVNTKPSIGDTVRVNAGTTLTTWNDNANGLTNWACGTNMTVAQVGAALWYNSGLGYNPAGDSPWTAANTTKEQIGGGVRFIATNGTIPAVSINGVSRTTSGIWNWAYLEFHEGSEIVPIPVEDDMVTRGYACQEVGGGAVDADRKAQKAARKRFTRASLNLDTWNPSFTVTALVDGIGENQTLLTAQTRDRTKYLTFNTPDFAETNAAGDWGEPYREDYSIAPDAGINFDISADVNPDAHQTHDWPLRLNARGRFVQLRLSNTQGRCVLRNTTSAANLIDRATVVRV